MTVEIRVDVDEVYDELTWNERETFLKDHIDDASDDILVSEIMDRGISNEVILRISDGELKEILEERFDIVIN